MNKLLLVLLLCSISYALNAPYLISATAISDSSVQLAYRNNDAATTGFIIQRKDSTATIYHFIDSVKSPTQLTYTDIKGLLPTTLYTYQIIAYDATEVSDTSNSVQVTTLATVAIFKQPSVYLSWYYDNSTAVKIIIFDSSNCETGYRIYREDGYSSSFSLIAQLISANPNNMDSIIWYDSTASFNKWYNYEVAAYKSDDSLFSNPCSTYTFHSIQPQNIVLFQKLSDFPVSDSANWSAKAGDSIILKENNSPAGKFSVINVSNTAHPSFAGYIDSTAAKSYPLQTLVPEFLNFGVFNSYNYPGMFPARESFNSKVMPYKDRMLVLQGDTLCMYRIVGNNLVVVDSLFLVLATQYLHGGNSPTPSGLTLLNDTLCIVRYDELSGYSGFFFYWYFQPLYLSASGFISLPLYQYASTYNVSYSYWLNIRAFDDSTILFSTNYSYNWVIGNDTSNLIIYNAPSNRNIIIPPSIIHARSFNTGYYLSSTENLYISGDSSTKELIFASDVRNANSYQTARANNAIYRDSIHTRNTLQNILLDTLNKQIFLMFTNNMSILSYQTANGVISKANKIASSKGLMVLSSVHVSGVTIVLPSHSSSSPADLYFYDLSGRVVDRLLGVTSNAVLWRPKTRSMSCYILMARIGGEKYTKKFMVR
ncbi:MAG: hypothetical protein ABSF80_11035 [Chitinispirillaceae bacterium]|jgi:hypothetical protein